MSILAEKANTKATAIPPMIRPQEILFRSALRVMSQSMPHCIRALTYATAGACVRMNSRLLECPVKASEFSFINRCTSHNLNSLQGRVYRVHLFRMAKKLAKLKFSAKTTPLYI